MVDCIDAPELTVVVVVHFTKVVAFTIELTSETLPGGIVHLISYSPVNTFANGALVEIYHVDGLTVLNVITLYKNFVACDEIFTYTFSPPANSPVSTYVPIAGWAPPQNAASTCG